jgi:hypothetical protein
MLTFPVSLAFPQREGRKQLVTDVGGGDAGDLGVVVGRDHLDDAGAGRAQALHVGRGGTSEIMKTIIARDLTGLRT